MGATIEYEIFDTDLGEYITLLVFLEEWELMEIVRRKTGDEPLNMQTVY